MSSAVPLGLAIAQSWLLYYLLGQHECALQAYDELLRRLASVERELNELTWGPGVLDPRRVVGLPEDAIIYRTVTPRRGVRFEVALDPRRMDPITDAIVAGDRWFLRDYAVLLELLRPGDTVLDLGGHVGTFALAAAALGCRVACVEAAPRHVRLLEASVARNGFDALHVVHGAVTDHEGSIEFFPSGPWGTIANPVVEGSPEMIYARTLAPVTVPAVTVDGLLERLGWDRVDVVKIDVEGGEIGAVRGMTELLSRPDAPVVLYESNTDALQFFGHTPADLLAALERHGYASYRVEPGRLVPARPGELEVDSVVNRLAAKGQLPEITGWRVTGPRSLEETIRRVIGQLGSPRAFDRAFVARALAGADSAILAEPKVRLALRRLSRDPDESVRRAAAWFLPADRSAPAGPLGWP